MHRSEQIESWKKTNEDRSYMVTATVCDKILLNRVKQGLIGVVTGLVWFIVDENMIDRLRPI